MKRGLWLALSICFLLAPSELRAQATPTPASYPPAQSAEGLSAQRAATERGKMYQAGREPAADAAGTAAPGFSEVSDHA